MPCRHGYQFSEGVRLVFASSIHAAVTGYGKASERIPAKVGTDLVHKNYEGCDHSYLRVLLRTVR
jgi:hypothetical protein